MGSEREIAMLDYFKSVAAWLISLLFCFGFFGLLFLFSEINQNIITGSIMGGLYIAFMLPLWNYLLDLLDR